MDALGDPPNIYNLDSEFWRAQEGAMRAEMIPLLHKLALQGTEALAPTKAEPIPILWDEAVISEEALTWARTYGYDLIRQLEDRTQRLVRDQVAEFVSTPGGTIGQLRATLTSAFGARRAQTIAVTETTRAYSEGMTLVHQQVSRAGIQMDKIWQTANDEKVCPICGPNHDKPEREWTQVSGPPPAHPNCRCWVTLRLPEMAGTPAIGSDEWIMANASRNAEPVQRHGMASADAARYVDYGKTRIWFAEDGPDLRETLRMLANSDIPTSLSDNVRELILTPQRDLNDENRSKMYGIPFRTRATGGDGSIVVYGGGAPSLFTYAHEAGHILAQTEAGQPVFAQFSKLHRQGMEPSPTAYGREHAQEDFADSVALFVTDPTRLLAVAPLRHALLRALLGV